MFKLFNKYNEYLIDKFQNSYVFMFKPRFGFHRMIRESKNCYFIYDEEARRPHGYLKRAWYIIKVWKGLK